MEHGLGKRRKSDPGQNGHTLVTAASVRIKLG